MTHFCKTLYASVAQVLYNVCTAVMSSIYCTVKAEGSSLSRRKADSACLFSIDNVGRHQFEHITDPGPVFCNRLLRDY